MSRPYGKVVVGEAVADETSPFLAPAQIGRGGSSGSGDVETATGVVVAESSYFFRPPPRFPHPHPHPHPHPPLPHHPPLGGPLHAREPGEDSCAQLGCCLSWVPPIGFLTCIIHADAPPTSRREWLAHRACAIASIVTIALVVYFSVWYNSNSTKVQFHS